MKNKIFNCTRFYNMVRSDLIINYKRNILVILGMGVILYLIFIWNMFVSNGRIEYEPFFVFWCIAAIVLIVGYSFPEFSNKIQTANYLLLPASILEKFLYQFLIKGIVITILFLLIFWIDAHLAASSSIITYYEDGKVFVQKPFHFSDMDIFHGEMLLRDKLAVITGILSFLSLLLAIRMFFGRYAIMKTAIVFLILIFVWFFVFIILSHIYHPEITHGFEVELRGYEVSENLANIQLYSYCIVYVSWIFFLAIGYFKLKEKQA